mmetsp:Transcript_62764/g.111502  ORF Transcript_62764/g.111502 Transcript_62764/m.111502 type:complete len:154 (-) Transcript_62764:63-524(-)
MQLALHLTVSLTQSLWHQWLQSIDFMTCVAPLRLLSRLLGLHDLASEARLLVCLATVQVIPGKLQIRTPVQALANPHKVFLTERMIGEKSGVDRLTAEFEAGTPGQIHDRQMLQSSRKPGRHVDQAQNLRPRNSKHSANSAKRDIIWMSWLVQ